MVRAILKNSLIGKEVSTFMSTIRTDEEGHKYIARDFADDRELDIEYAISKWPEFEATIDGYSEALRKSVLPWRGVVEYIQSDLRKRHPELIEGADAVLTIYYRPSTGAIRF